jgi:hypothetical protein
MDFNQLKSLARKLGGILVMNGNAPEFVILTYDDFDKLQKNKDLNGRAVETQSVTEGGEEDIATIERLNQEISALKEEIRQKEEAELVEAEDGETEKDETGMKEGDLTI